MLSDGNGPPGASSSRAGTALFAVAAMAGLAPLAGLDQVGHEAGDAVEEERVAHADRVGLHLAL